VAAAPIFNTLLLKAAEADTGRGGEQVPTSPAERFARMLERLTTDTLWEKEYEEFVHNVSFAKPDEMISFSKALAATAKLVASASP